MGKEKISGKKYEITENVQWRGRRFIPGDKIQFVGELDKLWGLEYYVLPESAKDEMKPFLK